MLRKLLQKFQRTIRHLLGIDLLIRYQQRQIKLLWSLLERAELRSREIKKLSDELEVTKLFLEHSLIDGKKIKSTIIYKRCAEIIALLSPMDVIDGNYVRVGNEYDGGYVMLDNFSGENVDAAYSFGIGDDVSWDSEIATRGINVFMFDHTIDELPGSNSRFQFFKTGVTGKKAGEKLKTLSDLVQTNGHANSERLLMKMDIEGCEWDVLDESPREVIKQFSQIVIELHGLFPIAEDQKYLSIIRILKKINVTHQSVHVHANTCSNPLWIGDLVLPKLLEVTFIRRSDVKDKLVDCTRRFPTSIDRPTFIDLHDQELGGFSIDG